MIEPQRIKISWSAYERWKKCPYQYYLYYVKRQGYLLDDLRNRAHAMMGSVLQEIFTRYYNEELWKLNQPEEYLIKDLLPKIWQFIKKSIVVDWEEKGLEEKEVYQKVVDLIPKITTYLKTNLLDTQKLMRSEMKLAKPFSKNLKLTGKLDFFLNLGENKYILDGKATKHVDVKQLHYYCLIYKLIHQKLPTKIGFLFYEVPEVQFYDPDETILNELQTDLLKLEEDLLKENFPVTPSKEVCKDCLFRHLCKESQYTEEDYQ